MSTGILRWVTWGIGEEWHLRFGAVGPALCDRTVMAHPRTRWLSEGAPARRCAGCSDVIRLRLGLPEAPHV
jgi:hypothetical protein